MLDLYDIYEHVILLMCGSLELLTTQLIHVCYGENLKTSM